MSDIMPNEMSPTADWNDEDWKMMDVWIRSVLTQNTVVVTFTKKDGEERVMTCTLNPALLPAVVIKEAVDGEVKVERKKSDTSIAVYDLTAEAWRSFIVKSVKSVTFTL